MRALLLATLALLAAWLPTGAAVAAPKATDVVGVELVAEPRAIEPGQTFTVAVRLTMAEHWHTYWRNPGDSGLATEIAWTLPPGFAAGAIRWPTPRRIPVSHLVNYGYEDAATLLVEITAPASLPKRPVELKAQVHYLVCQKECIPGEATVATTVPVAAGPGEGGPDPRARYIFDEARAALPAPTDWPARLEPSGSSAFNLRIETGGRQGAFGSAYFFPADETAVEHAAPQTVAADASGLTLTLKRSSLATGPAPPTLAGVLTLGPPEGDDGATRAYQIGPDAAPVGAGAKVASAQEAPRPVETSLAAVAGAVLFAFLGGLILNLMPCVFPVLSIKVMSLVRHAGEGGAAIRHAGLAYTAGVLASFALLAAVLLAVRAAGAEIGWGFQLQSPVVVAGLAFLLFAVGLGLSGVADFGSWVAVRAAALDSRAGLSGSFLTGVLATAVAAPCTAPFMGAALGYALAAPAPAALVVFLALGFGMALPFLLLTFWPGLLGRLPRPGAWMETLKQVLAFPVYATVAWLLFVLSQQVGPSGLLAAMIGLVVLAFGLWSWQAGWRHDGWGRGFARAGALASVAALAFLGAAIARDPGPLATSTAQAGEAGRFTQARLDALRAEGRPVFVNMTAAWCLSCIVNERLVLSRPSVQAELERRQVTYLKGDWTNRNPEITRLLEQHGRSGVPLYVLYPARGAPVVLPEILTESIVLEGLDRISPVTKQADLAAPPQKE